MFLKSFSMSSISTLMVAKPKAKKTMMKIPAMKLPAQVLKTNSVLMRMMTSKMILRISMKTVIKKKPNRKKLQRMMIPILRVCMEPVKLWMKSIKKSRLFRKTAIKSLPMMRLKMSLMMRLPLCLEFLMP